MIWDLGSASRIAARQLGELESNLGRPSFSADGSLLAVPNWTDDILWIVDVASGRSIAELPARQCHAAVFSADGSEVAVDTLDDIVIWDWASGEHRHSFSGHQDPVKAITFSADGQFLISGDREGELYVWHVPSGLQVCKLKDFSPRRVKSLAFASSGNQLACVLDQSNVVLLGDLEPQDERATDR